MKNLKRGFDNQGKAYDVVTSSLMYKGFNFLMPGSWQLRTRKNTQSSLEVLVAEDQVGLTVNLSHSRTSSYTYRYCAYLLLT